MSDRTSTAVPGQRWVSDAEPELDAAPLVTERRDDAGLSTVMTNNFGFGGTNASLVLRRYDGP